MCLNPRWTDGEYGTYYSGFYYEQYHRGAVSVEDRPSDTQTSRAAVVAQAAGQLLGDRSAPPRILEIGCGAGANLVAMASAVTSAHLVGLDPDAAMCAALKDRFPNWTMMVGTLVTAADQVRAAGPFDLVLLSGVLEHFADPVHALRIVRGLLKADGRVFTLVPNLDVLVPFHDQFTVPHTHYFTRRTFEAVHEVAGLTPGLFVDDLPDELCCVSTIGPAVEWKGPSDLQTVERRAGEGARVRAFVRTVTRRAVEHVVPESTVYRLQDAIRSVVRSVSRSIRIG